MRNLLRFLPLLLVLLTVLAFSAPVSASPVVHAHPVVKSMPAHPDCDTLPNNTDCNGQPTPGGCATTERAQPGVFGQVFDKNGTLMATVVNYYSSHCMSNFPQAQCSYNTTDFCYTQTQRYSGPDGGGFVLSSQVYSAPSQPYGVLVYAPNNQTSVKVCAQDAAQNYYSCSAWTTAW